MARRKIGIWIIGAKGGVASTVTVGLIALKKGLAPNHGLVTQLPLFADADLAGFGDFTIGGHEIRDVSLYDEAMQMVRVSRAIDADLVAKCKADLDKIDKNIKPGTLWNVGSKIEGISGDESRKLKNKETPRAAIDRLQKDLQEFQKKNDLDQVVVVNLASTEPPVDEAELPARWKDLAKTLAKNVRCRPVRCTRSRPWNWDCPSSTSRLRSAPQRRRCRSWRSKRTPATWVTTARRAKRS